MAAYEDSYKSQLQGVSQQIARDRLDGQVSAQENMLSDKVTNLRRRPGARHLFHFPLPASFGASIAAWEAQIGERNVVVLLNAKNGDLRILGDDYLVAWVESCPYLITTDISTIQVASLNGEFVMANTAHKPTLGGPSTAPHDADKQGFFYVRAGAFSKPYTVYVGTSLGSNNYTYTTPASTVAGAAENSTPEKIATEIAAKINVESGATGAVATVIGNAVSIVSTQGELTVSTPSGASYILASNRMLMRDEADLPLKLPDNAEGFTVRIGEESAARYYRYNAGRSVWLEAGALGSPTSIIGMPVRIRYGIQFELDQTEYEGRLAGDDTTNPAPSFIETGITGMSTYQGRLVLFAGSKVYLSASGNVTRFFRSTVVSLLDNDTIGIGSSGAASAVWRYGIPYQKDLVLFSADEQGIIPGSSVAITPRTAVVLPSTKYTFDPATTPVVAGRNLMYSSPRSGEFFGIMEMSPSTVTEGQYVSDDATPHLPKYLPGRCRFIVSSSVANMVVMGHTGDLRTLTVHEYFWNAGEKVQQAWHRWTFPYDITNVFFRGNSIIVMFLQNDMLVGCAIDPRAAGYNNASQRRPFLDMYDFTPVTDRAVAMPQWMLEFDPSIYQRLKVAIADGPLAGEEVGFDTGFTHPSFQNGTVAVGLPFRSSVIPTAPMMKDEDGVKISSNKLTITRFSVGTNKSSAYKVIVRDKNSIDPESVTYSTLYFSSPELELGKALEGGDSTAIVPARMLADSLVLELYTEGTGELNLVGLEFVAKYHEKIKRR